MREITKRDGEDRQRGTESEREREQEKGIVEENGKCGEKCLENLWDIPLILLASTRHIFAEFNTLVYNSKWPEQGVLKGTVSLYH